MKPEKCFLCILEDMVFQDRYAYPASGLLIVVKENGEVTVYNDARELAIDTLREGLEESKRLGEEDIIKRIESLIEKARSARKVEAVVEHDVPLTKHGPIVKCMVKVVVAE